LRGGPKLKGERCWKKPNVGTGAGEWAKRIWAHEGRTSVGLERDLNRGQGLCVIVRDRVKQGWRGRKIGWENTRKRGGPTSQTNGGDRKRQTPGRFQEGEQRTTGREKREGERETSTKKRSPLSSKQNYIVSDGKMNTGGGRGSGKKNQAPKKKPTESGENSPPHTSYEGKTQL